MKAGGLSRVTNVKADRGKPKDDKRSMIEISLHTAPPPPNTSECPTVHFHLSANWI